MLRAGFMIWLLFLSTVASAHPLVFGDADGGTRPVSLTEVVARMDRIARVLPADDGITQFNHLYETTTQNMIRGINEGDFEDGAFMTDFTVHFASFYFEAVSEYFSPSGHTPQAWLALFENRGRSRELKPVQFALAGMHAHINRDLPVVLSELFRDDSSFPAANSASHRDYLKVNQVLSDTFDQLRDELLDGPMWFRLLGDATALPWVRVLRDKAWLDGDLYWKLRNHEQSQELYLESLDVATRGEALGYFLIRL